MKYLIVVIALISPLAFLFAIVFAADASHTLEQSTLQLSRVFIVLCNDVVQVQDALLFCKLVVQVQDALVFVKLVL